MTYMGLTNILTLRVGDELLEALRDRANNESRTVGAALRLTASERLHDLGYLLSPEEIEADLARVFAPGEGETDG